MDFGWIWGGNFTYQLVLLYQKRWHKKIKRSVLLAIVFPQYWALLKDKNFNYSAIGAGLLMGAMFVYISVAPVDCGVMGVARAF